MKRVSLALLLSIAVLTGFTTRGVFVAPVRSLHSQEVSAAGETGTVFYAALNDALGGASTDPLAELLSSIFVDHDADTGETRSAGAFLAEVRAYGASESRARIEVTAIEAMPGGSLAVSAQLVDNGPLVVAGMTAEQSIPEPHVEVLRVQRGKIVDRWAPRYAWLDVSELAEDAPTLSTTIGFSTTLMRFELSGSDERAWRASDLGIALAETGSVSLAISGQDGSQSVVPLEEGAFASISRGARVRMRVTSGSSATVVIYQATRFAVTDVSPAGAGIDQGPQGGSRTVLWSGVGSSSGTVTVHRPARIVLPAHAEIELARPENAALLVGGSAAGIEVVVPGGNVAVLDANRWPELFDGLAELDAAHAGWIERDGLVLLRNPTDRSVTLVLVSIETVPASYGAAGPCPYPCLPPALSPMPVPMLE